MLQEVGKFIIIFGIILVIIGLLLTLNTPFLGRLSGDIVIKKGNFTFYFPLMTSLILSLILTLILNLILRR